MVFDRSMVNVYDIAINQHYTMDPSLRPGHHSYTDTEATTVGAIPQLRLWNVRTPGDFQQISLVFGWKMLEDTWCCCFMI